MDFHQWLLIHNQTALSYLFLYLGVLTFTFRTPLNNRLARVSKSRTGDSDSVCNSSDKACRIDGEYSTGRGANLKAFARWRWLRIHLRHKRTQSSPRA